MTQQGVGVAVLFATSRTGCVQGGWSPPLQPNLPCLDQSSVQNCTLEKPAAQARGGADGRPHWASVPPPCPGGHLAALHWRASDQPPGPWVSTQTASGDLPETPQRPPSPVLSLLITWRSPVQASHSSSNATLSQEASSDPSCPVRPRTALAEAPDIISVRSPPRCSPCPSCSTRHKHHVHLGASLKVSMLTGSTILHTVGTW